MLCLPPPHLAPAPALSSAHFSGSGAQPVSHYLLLEQLTPCLRTESGVRRRILDLPRPPSCQADLVQALWSLRASLSATFFCVLTSSSPSNLIAPLHVLCLPLSFWSQLSVPSSHFLRKAPWASPRKSNPSTMGSKGVWFSLRAFPTVCEFVFICGTLLSPSPSYHSYFLLHWKPPGQEAFGSPLYPQSLQQCL
jgi:hypothetical protein